jgi:hypothetical protein
MSQPWDRRDPDVHGATLGRVLIEEPGVVVGARRSTDNQATRAYLSKLRKPGC